MITVRIKRKNRDLVYTYSLQKIELPHAVVYPVQESSRLEHGPTRIEHVDAQLRKLHRGPEVLDEAQRRDKDAMKNFGGREAFLRR